MVNSRKVSVLLENVKGSSSAFENGDILEEEGKDVKKKVMPWARNNQQKKAKKSSMKPNCGNKKPVAPVQKGERTQVKTNEAVVKIEEDSAREDDLALEESENNQPEEAVKSLNNDSSEPEKNDDQLEELKSDVTLRY